MRNDLYLYTGAPLPQVTDDMFAGFRKDLERVVLQLAVDFVQSSRLAMIRC